MASAVLEEEVPCRDTDPLPSKDQDSNRDSPVAFTINFGLGDEDGELSKEKAKKLERFALRSSLRKPKSPRLPQSNSPSNNTSNNNNNMVKSGGLVREKSNLSFRGSYRAKSATATSNNTTKSPTSYHNNSPTSYTTQQQQQHSVMSTPSSAKAAYRKDSSSNTTRHNETMSKLNQHSNSTLSSVPRDAPRDQNAALSRDRNEKSSSSARHHNSEQSADARRRLTTTLSPEEAKMISHFEKEIEAHSLEIVERSYEDDEFELESCPSETGTYTVGKDEEKKNQTAASEEKARYELENLVGENQTRNNYVQDWANRHAAHHNRHSPDTSGDVPPSHGHRRNSPTHHARVSRGVSAPSLRPTLIPTPPLPGGDSGMCGDDGDLSPQPLGSGSGGTANSLSKSRRRLPPTPGGVSSTPMSGILSPESNPEFSPSTDSPSPTQESDEGENSYMKHTQHLVNVMEARINQVSGHTTSTSRAIKTSTIVKKKSTTTLPSNDGVSAKEAWERRKNYDPLIASGRKKEPVSGRKSSSSSIGRSPREDIKYEERGSAKSASSDSSGYFSRGEVGRHPSSLNRGDGGRFSMRGNPHKLKAISRPGVVSSKPANKPQSKLLATDKQNSRSSSCLTSKEAEFQAWKRRKNYDPLKSATASAAGIRNGSGNSTIRENGNSANCDRSIGNSSLIGSHRSSGGESDSGGGRFSGTAENNSGRFARSPRNAYAPSPTPHHQQTGSIQHKRIQEMSQSLIHGGAGSRGSHHVASTSDQPPPMQRSASFHYENIRMRGASNGNSGESDHHQLRMYSLQGTHPDDFAPRGGMRGNTSEDESTEDYGSGCDSSNAEGVPRHYYLDEDELILPIYPSSSHRSIYNRSLSPKPSPSRSRSRLEALDNLVISTIYSVSSKLCNNTQSILKRAGLTFPPADEDQATTLETVLYLLEDVDLPCSPAKKTSRELSGTLRNLKKVEQALEVLHKLIESDQDD